MYTFFSKCDEKKDEAGGDQGGEGGKKHERTNGQWWHSNLVPLNDNENDNDNDNDKMVSFLTFLKLLKWQ